MFLYLLAGIICLLVACALVVLWHFRRTVALSSPTGPFAVGRVSYQWVDPSPPETFSKSRTPDARWWCGFGTLPPLCGMLTRRRTFLGNGLR